MSTPVPIVSVVVPAHDEEALIVRCLQVLLTGSEPGATGVHVVVNGSTDGTAAVVRAWAASVPWEVDVVEIPTAGKSGALRIGAARCTPGVRVVLDADVELAPEVLGGLVDALSGPGVRVASPGLRVRTARSHRAVRAYFRVWTHLPYTGPGMVGSGVYALSAAAVLRLGDVPDVTNDDGYVMRSFAAAERVTTPGVFTTSAPVTARALCARRARIHNGNRELAERGLPAVEVLAGPGLRDLVRARAVGPADAAVYVALTAASRVLAAWRRRRGRALQWSTDRTTRIGAAP